MKRIALAVLIALGGVIAFAINNHATTQSPVLSPADGPGGGPTPTCPYCPPGS